jgi:hypothetical protein
MKAASGNHTVWGSLGAGRRVDNQKSRFNTLFLYFLES